MKRLTISVFFLFLLAITIPTTSFAGHNDHGRRYHSTPRHRHHSTVITSVHAEAGLYYKPYYGSQYYLRYERRVIIADSSCGGLFGFLFGDSNDNCGRKTAAEARKIEAEAALRNIDAGVEIRKAELERDILLRGSGAFGGESGYVEFRGSHLGSGEMSVERGKQVASIPRCSREILEKEGIWYSARTRIFEDRSGNRCYYGGE